MKLFFTMLLLSMGSLACFGGLDVGNDPFVIGFYSTEPQNDATMQLVKAAGAEYVHSYNVWKGKSATTLLDLAQKHKLKVMYDLGGSTRIWQSGDPEWQSKLLQTIRQVKDHPALGFWYLWDEPASNMLSKVKELHALVKTESAIPTALVIHERGNYWDSRGYSDIWMADNYPIRGEVFPDVPLQWHSRMMRNAAASYNYKGTPFIAVVQACDFSCFRSNVKKPENLARLRFPNSEEMRFIAFSDLCYGIRGMLFFSLAHCHLDRPAGKAYFHGVLTPMISDIKAFLAVVPDVWNVTVRDSKKIDAANKVSFAFFKRASGSYMILVNDTAEKRDLKINLSEFPAIPRQAKLVPWRFTRASGVLESGVLSVASVAPWEVSVWEVQP